MFTSILFSLFIILFKKKISKNASLFVSKLFNFLLRIRRGKEESEKGGWKGNEWRETDGKIMVNILTDY